MFKPDFRLHFTYFFAFPQNGIFGILVAFILCLNCRHGVMRVSWYLIMLSLAWTSLYRISFGFVYTWTSYSISISLSMYSSFISISLSFPIFLRWNYILGLTLSRNALFAVNWYFCVIECSICVMAIRKPCLNMHLWNVYSFLLLESVVAWVYWTICREMSVFVCNFTWSTPNVSLRAFYSK